MLASEGSEINIYFGEQRLQVKGVSIQVGWPCCALHSQKSTHGKLHEATWPPQPPDMNPQIGGNHA